MRRTYKDCHRRYNYKIVCKDLAVSYQYEGKSGRDFYDEKFEHMWACKYPESALFIYDKHYNDELYHTIRANGGWDNWEFVKIGITYRPIRKKKRRPFRQTILSVWSI